MEVEGEQQRHSQEKTAGGYGLVCKFDLCIGCAWCLGSYLHMRTCKIYNYWSRDFMKSKIDITTSDLDYEIYYFVSLEKNK